MERKVKLPEVQQTRLVKRQMIMENQKLLEQTRPVKKEMIMKNQVVHQRVTMIQK